ncbi:MAG: hypothetical protein QHC67_01180 [Sphingobium sp.]|nr:hypothetical protein [Sphingobium sp.]
MPDAARSEMAEVLEDGSADIQKAVLRETPRRKGALQNAIRTKVLKQTLSAKIGIIGPPAERRSVFYGRILDLGRRAQVVKAVRRAPSGKVSRYLMRVRGIAAKRFISGPRTDARALIANRLRGVWDRILKRLSGGNDG